MALQSAVNSKKNLNGKVLTLQRKNVELRIIQNTKVSKNASSNCIEKTQLIFLYPGDCALKIVNTFDVLKTKLHYSHIINIVQP